MRVRKLALLGIAAAGLAALAVRRREPPVSMHGCDWQLGGPGASRRRYLNPAHFAHHAAELAGLLPQVAAVYVLRALDPAFREKVMIITALSNDCPP